MPLETAEQTVESPRPPRLARLRRLLARLPRWVIPLVLMAVVLPLDAFGIIRSISPPGYQVTDLITRSWFLAAIFMAGPIHRRSWRHALVLLGCMLAAGGSGYAVKVSGISEAGYRPYLWPVENVLLIWALGVGEMLTAGPRRAWMVPWTLVAAAGAAALLQTLYRPIDWTGWTVGIPQVISGASSRKLVSLLWWPLLALAAWPAVLLALKARQRRFAVAGAAAFASAMAIHGAFFYWGAFALAKPSLAGRGPFTRRMGVVLLEARGREEDFDRILEALCAADWQQPLQYGPASDWRRTALTVLSRHDAAAIRSATALAGVLRKRRTSVLAGMTADLLITHRRYEVVPVLFRYSVLCRRRPANTECVRALEKARLPEAALPILSEAYAYDRAMSGPQDFPIDPARCGRLKALLGKDVGSMYSAWAKAVDEALATSSSSLPEQVQEELDREVVCWIESARIMGRMREARRAVGAWLTKAHRERLERLLDRQIAAGKDAWDVPMEVFFAAAGRARYPEQEMAAFGMDWPDADAPTVEAYEAEVRACGERVDAVIRRCLPLPPATQAADSRPARP